MADHARPGGNYAAVRTEGLYPAPRVPEARVLVDFVYCEHSRRQSYGQQRLVKGEEERAEVEARWLARYYGRPSVGRA